MKILLVLGLLFQSVECLPFTQDDVDQLQTQIDILQIDRETLETQMDQLKQEMSLLE